MALCLQYHDSFQIFGGGTSQKLKLFSIDGVFTLTKPLAGGLGSDSSATQAQADGAAGDLEGSRGRQVSRTAEACSRLGGPPGPAGRP